MISHAEMGDKWPFTVETGELRCDRDRVTFITGGVTYALNGTARTQVSNTKDIFEISQVDPIFVRTPENPVTRLRKSIRRNIVKTMAECRAGKTPDVDIEHCDIFIKAKHLIDDDELERIISEGMILEWDPHRLPRMSTEDLIQRGLKLCDA